MGQVCVPRLLSSLLVPLDSAHRREAIIISGRRLRLGRGRLHGHKLKRVQRNVALTSRSVRAQNQKVRVTAQNVSGALIGQLCHYTIHFFSTHNDLNIVRAQQTANKLSQTTRKHARMHELVVTTEVATSAHELGVEPHIVLCAC